MSYDNYFEGGLNRAGVDVPNHAQWRITAESLYADRDIFNPTATKKFPLGALAESRDGKRWRYCENANTELAIALVNQQEAVVANWQDIGQDNSPAAFAVGDKRVTVTLTDTAVAGDFIDGYLVVEDGDGEGNMYLVKDNKTGVVNLTTGFDIVVDIADAGGIRIATLATSGTTLTMLKNKNKDVVVEAGTGVAVGVNHVVIAANYFFWAQTRGACPVKSATTIGVIGDAVMVVSGSVKVPGAAATDVIVGHVLRAAANTETALIDLNIE